MDTDRQLEIARSLFRESNDAFFVFDPRSRLVVDLNPAALRLAELTRKVVMGLPVDELFTSETRGSEGLKRLIEALEKTSDFLTSEDFLLTRPGKQAVPVNVSVTRIHTTPDPLGLIVARDVTDRRRAEEILDRFFRLSPALFAVIDKSGRIQRLNPAWEAVLGYEFSEISALGLESLILPDDRVAWREAFRSLGTAEFSGVEVRVRHKDGGERWLSWSAAHDGGSIYAVATEITSRKQAEALRLANEEAELASRAKDRFLAVLSHELRTPLTPILAAVSDLLDNPELSATVRPTLEMVRRNVSIEARLIDDLLDISRIVRSSLRIEPIPLDAHELVQQTAGLFEGEASSAGIRLVIGLDATRHNVLADPARFQQTVWNLVQNALKFTPRGGIIEIRSSNELIVGSDRPVLLIAVRDTGIGIEPEKLPKIFEAFEQVRETSKRVSGLGLGLTISRSLAEALGGSLVATSPGVGFGSTFTLRLPTIPRPRTAPTPSSSPEDPSRNPERSLRILLVEDNEDTLRYLSQILTRRGHVVQTADHLAAALRAMSEGTFDLLLTDMELPDGSGLDIMRALDGRTIPGIVMSGYGTDEDVRQSLRAGYSEHLCKPIDFHGLEVAIQRVTSAVGPSKPDSPSLAARPHEAG